MKHKLTTLLFLAFTSLMYAQHNSSIDLVGSIDYSFRTSSYSGADDFFSEFTQNRNATETGKSNWRFGINFNKRLPGNLFLKTGLRLASVGYKGEDKMDISTVINTEDQGSPITIELFKDLQFIYNYIFLEAPLVVRWEMNSKKWSPYIEAGISPYIYLLDRQRTITNNSNEVLWSRNPNYNLQTLQFVTSFSLGINYKLSNTYQIFAQPVGRYHITSLGKGPVKERLWSVGVEIGVRKGL